MKDNACTSFKSVRRLCWTEPDQAVGSGLGGWSNYESQAWMMSEICSIDLLIQSFAGVVRQPAGDGSEKLLQARA